MSSPKPKPSITITHLSADATFLLTYSPLVLPAHLKTGVSDPPAPFTILLDPWLLGPSPVFHPSFSTQSHTIPPSISHLSQLPHPPDLVLISQDKSDHCNEETLRQLSVNPGGRDENVRIFAVRGAAAKVKGWLKFGKGVHDRICELSPWKPPVGSGKSEEGVGGMMKIEIPVDKSFQKSSLGKISAHVEISNHPAVYPWEFPSIHSALAVRFVTTYTSISENSNSPDPVNTSITHTYLSVFSPHGVPPSALLPYLHHLYPSPSTPIIDLLLHPFTLTTTPPHLGGKITLGLPNIAKLIKCGVGVRVVVSTHDEQKEVGGYVSSRIKCRRWTREEAEKEIWDVALKEVEPKNLEQGTKSELLPEVWDLENGESRECLQ